jgi:hypothetical protein
MIGVSKIGIEIRRYASSSSQNDRISIEGKSAGKVSMLWDKYKGYALGAGGVVAAVGLLGVTASAVAIGGLATLAGGVYMWWTRRLKHQQNVLRELYEPLIDLNRPEIEKWIGPFELPDSASVPADEARTHTPSGAKELIVRNVFYLDGKWGKALVRALGARDESEEGKYSLRKLIIDVTDFKHTKQHTIALVDITPTLEYVDAPSFTAYSLKDYVDIKIAAREAARKSSREQYIKNQEERIKMSEKKLEELEKPKLYSHKPRQPKTKETQ